MAIFVDDGSLDIEEAERKCRAEMRMGENQNYLPLYMNAE
jgi:hypothetical protein